MAPLASSSVACSCRWPARTTDRLSTLVGSTISATSGGTSAASQSSRPVPGSMPSMRGSEGRATSASIRITLWSRSAAMLMARLTAQKLLPSPGKALVTMTRLPL